MAKTDQRNHITLVEDEYREKLARIEGDIIPSYVSWAMRIQLYRRYGELAEERREASVKDSPAWAKWDSYRIKFEKSVQYLQRAWDRNLDMSVADKGKGRQELLAAVTTERGAVLPSEYAGSQKVNGQQQQPQVVVNAAGSVMNPKPKPSIFQQLRPKL